MVSFDPYLNWLGIPPHEQPANFYRLLGIVLFESNPEVIEQAADRQSLRVGAYQSGPQGELCQQLLSEIAMARFCLMDAQQKASYDGQLLEGLARRGERTVAAAPPPALPVGPSQFGPAPPQFGPAPQQFNPTPPQFNPASSQFNPASPQFGSQAGMGPIHPGIGMPSPMTMPGPPPPMPSPMPGMSAMPGPAAMSVSLPPPQPVMPMPPAMMSAPPGFVPAMQNPSAPSATPLAAPFPVANAMAAVAHPAAALAAPPLLPPAAPQRPIDELESLTSQPMRRRFLKRKKKADYTKEIIFGGVVAAAGVLLFVVYAAIKSQDTSEHGYDVIKTEKPVESVRAAMDSAKKKFTEELQKKEKEKEEAIEKKAAADRALRSSKRSSAVGKADASLPKAYDFGPPSRAMDSPVPGSPIRSVRQPDSRDALPEPGGVDDPVMEKPPPP
ncbi:MAG: hypothetical protein ACLP9L_04660 [Thermoguttaceae bacterium]